MTTRTIYVWLKKGATTYHDPHGRAARTACGRTVTGDGRWQTGTEAPADRRPCARCAIAAADAARIATHMAPA